MMFGLNLDSAESTCIHFSEWAPTLYKPYLDIFGNYELDILMEKARKLKDKHGHISG